ncbi:HDOD domain-containing protein [Alteromonas sp. 5E99-2]|uniref:HDOD domain-containing protein n=1 Tax=Alteromonas sp. 5E99-2 TaxID=2817683 RepID=UPI001A97F6DB|nr:HDOD domain-containing protein [Alteromonas sp. 5E99-2]MBO1254453.1 HDOD domain-containing protein [Alteromonas sp. 5E99-2]
MSTQNALLTILFEKVKNDTLVLPTLPAIALEVRKAADDPEINLNKMADVIAKDPSLSARMIKIANSAYLGRTVKVESVSQAVTRIGLRQIKHIATALAMEQLFVSKNDIIAKYLSQEWEKTVAVVANSMAVLQTYAARTKNKEKSLDALALSALVHSIGVLPILTEAERHNDVFANPSFLEEAIKQTSGVIGGKIMEKWEFGPNFVAISKSWSDLSVVSDNIDYMDFVRIGAVLSGKMAQQKDAVINAAIERGVIESPSELSTDEFSDMYNSALAIFA